MPPDNDRLSLEKSDSFPEHQYVHQTESQRQQKSQPRGEPDQSSDLNPDERQNWQNNDHGYTLSAFSIFSPGRADNSQQEAEDSYGWSQEKETDEPGRGKNKDKQMTPPQPGHSTKKHASTDPGHQ